MLAEFYYYFIDVIISCLISLNNFSSEYGLNAYYNTRNKEMSDSKILDEISKPREEIVENLKKKASLMLMMKE